MADQMPELSLEVDTPLADHWRVAAVRGREEISRPWRYEVELYVHADAPLFSGDIGAIPGKQATLTIERDAIDETGGQKRTLEGIVSEFHFLGAVSGGWHIHRYRAVVVPHLWLASLRRQSRVLATAEAKDDADLVIEGLTQSDPLGAAAVLSSDDVGRDGVTRSLPMRDFVMQYEESDLDFYHRRLEKAGLFYVFDGDGKVLICDSNMSIPLMGDEEELANETYAGMTHSNARIATNVAVREVALPKKVALQAYNYQKPALDLYKEADVSDDGSGIWASLDENYIEPSQGETLAGLHAEEWNCGARVLAASTPVIDLCAGRVFTLTDHPDDDFNGDYVVVSAEILAARPSDERPEIPGAIDGYQCSFRAIPKATPFRSARTTPVPRVAGVISARVDGEEDEEPNIDDEGRYLLRFLFDRSDTADGAASARVRLMTPFGGASEGMHTPLRKGTEVLVGFVNGDVDRPVILGTVPDADHRSVVEERNRASSVMRNASGVVVTLGNR